MSEALKQTPLHAVHLRLGARMMPFGGFDMPVQYSGILDEHMAVRRTAGLFDVSHMGEILARGPNAFRFVQQLVTNDAAKLYDGRAMYTAMCREDGGIVDDLLVYRVSEEEYLLVVNSSNVGKDFAWMQAHNDAGAELLDLSEETALLALQGPEAFAIVQSVTEVPLGELKYYHFVKPTSGTFLGCRRAILSHTGYTGEPGLEIYCEAARAEHVWERLMEAGRPRGLKPAGLGARDTLRLEAGFALYGNDITEDTNPLEAGLGWVTKLDKDDFVGKAALLRIKAERPARRLVGFVMEERAVPRHGYPIVDGERTIGEVTSGSQSPILERGIGLGYVPNEPRYTEPGAPVGVSVRGRAVAARIRKPPFHKL